jgi:16S rRNA (cytidine1402-2'-O)-methyltransferase
MAGGPLFVVATPLGNLEDVSPRAVRVLREATVVFAEDTRRSRILCDHFGVGRPLRSLHEHNERERSAEVLERLSRGESVALLTDAGTPAVSDPGAELVARVAAAGYAVSPIPGPSALTAALSVAGFVQAQPDVRFLGFLPSKGAARAAALEAVVVSEGIVVLFEAPHRVHATLLELAARLPERPAMVARELSKMHEELVRGTLAELAAWAAGEVRGEITLVLGPMAREPVTRTEGDVDAALQRCLTAGLSPRDAATAVAAVLELPRREVYARCQQLRG